MINKIIYFVVIVLNFINLNAQVKSDESEIFKMQLFLNKKTFLQSNIDTLNNIGSSCKIFTELLILKMDKLKVENGLSDILETDYVFYKLKESEIVYKKKLSNEEYKYLDIGCYPDYYYILAINLKTGTSYRLAGFETNDFITFFIDFKNYYFGKNLNIKTFLKNYKVENLDFDCMYKGLNIEKNMSRVKYPCLMKCSDLLKIH